LKWGEASAIRSVIHASGGSPRYHGESKWLTLRITAVWAAAFLLRRQFDEIAPPTKDLFRIACFGRVTGVGKSQELLPSLLNWLNWNRLGTLQNRPRPRFSIGDNMKTRSIALTVVLCFLALTFSFAEDANMGTWKLNEAKSNLVPGMIKNTTVTYTTDGDNVKVTTDGTGADGQPMQTEWTGKFDGKDYPLTGDRSSDARSYTRVNDRTLNLENKKDGKVTTKGKIVVSKDGKTRTLTVSAKNPAGKTIKGISVYDKQ
jgi:hypothetical protein